MFAVLIPLTGFVPEQQEKKEAATKIQAAYRGHSVRQGLNWKLPSGQAFGASLRKAREKSKKAMLTASIEDSSRTSSLSGYSSAFDAGSDASLFSEETISTASLISDARKADQSRTAAFQFSRPTVEHIPQLLMLDKYLCTVSHHSFIQHPFVDACCTIISININNYSKINCTLNI